MTDLAKIATEAEWKALVEAVANGEVPMMELVQSCKAEPGDYFGHVQWTRACIMLMADNRIAIRLAAEMQDRVAKGERKEDSSVWNAALSTKEAGRRFEKAHRLRMDMASNSPSILRGATFEECLAQYLKIMAHLEQLWNDSRDFYRRGHYPLATFTALLLLEEDGKIGLIWHELLAYDLPRSTVKELSGVGKNDRQKAFIAVVAGALINERLDRILGLQAVRQALQDAESGELEKIWQACLYVDYVDGVVTTPDERIDRQRAEFLVVLAGEIWAEDVRAFPF